MGGRLAIAAELSNRPPVRIERLSALAGEGDETRETDQASHPRDDAA